MINCLLDCTIVFADHCCCGLNIFSLIAGTKLQSVYLLSDFEDQISGVIHGSGIEPSMFLIFRNELIEQYNIKV